MFWYLRLSARMAGRRCLSGSVKSRSAREQHLQGGEDRPAGHLGHGLDGEGEMPRSLAPRGVDEPQVRAVREQADRDLGLAQEPLESEPAGWPASGGPWHRSRRVIEVEAELDPLDQHEPLADRRSGVLSNSGTA